MKEVQFSETNWLRLTSVLCMGIADIALVADLWWMFSTYFLWCYFQNFCVSVYTR